MVKVPKKLHGCRCVALGLLMLGAASTWGATGPVASPDTVDVLVERLLTGENPQERDALNRAIAAKGDAAIEPLSKALGKAKTAEDRARVMWVLGLVHTPGAAQALIGLATDRDDTIRTHAISSLTDYLGVPLEKGGVAEVLPTLAKVLPGEKDQRTRESVCARVVRVLLPSGGKVDERVTAMATEMLRERLKNDGAARVRMWAAISLAEFDDRSGVDEMKKAVLVMQGGRGTDYDNQPGLGYPLERLIPALERATGKQFGKVPLNPMLSSNSRAGPTLEQQRQARLDTAADWVRANPPETAKNPQ